MNTEPNWENPDDVLIKRLAGERIDCTSCVHLGSFDSAHPWCAQRVRSPNAAPEQEPAIVGRPDEYLCVAFKPYPP